tara:strand:- start:3531 stop:4082 length:552 start_codon:yes stop_codon:yes gene_type:complete
MHRNKLFLPLVLFGGLVLLLFRGLSLDPTELPSALIDAPVPAFELPDLSTGMMVSEAIFTGEPALLNVWATWCYSCRIEHPYLLQLAAAGVKIIGLNYKDEPDSARPWLTDLGDPYRLNISDTEGTLGLDLGVYGAPETFVISTDGRVLYRHVGVVDESVWLAQLNTFFPAVTMLPGTSDDLR